jgi:hypothetical protein
MFLVEQEQAKAAYAADASMENFEKLQKCDANVNMAARSLAEAGEPPGRLQRGWNRAQDRKGKPATHRTGQGGSRRFKAEFVSLCSVFALSDSITAMLISKGSPHALSILALIDHFFSILLDFDDLCPWNRFH